jgi:CheY-like chemotaxis protein
VSNWHVLVVEDDPDGQEVVTRMLRHHQITTDVVDNAEDALALLARQQYTLAVVDLALPTTDGWTLLEQIKANPAYKNMPCIAVTAFHSA